MFGQAVSFSKHVTEIESAFEAGKKSLRGFPGHDWIRYPNTQRRSEQSLGIETPNDEIGS